MTTRTPTYWIAYPLSKSVKQKKAANAANDNKVSFNAAEYDSGSSGRTWQIKRSQPAI
jgi:hypothetical protein